MHKRSFWSSNRTWTQRYLDDDGRTAIRKRLIDLPRHRNVYNCTLRPVSPDAISFLPVCSHYAPLLSLSETNLDGLIIQGVCRIRQKIHLFWVPKQKTTILQDFDEIMGSQYISVSISKNISIEIQRNIFSILSKKEFWWFMVLHRKRRDTLCSQYSNIAVRSYPTYSSWLTTFRKI